jgi:pimeloyl-ACP methyl ester carboxylesterase
MLTPAPAYGDGMAFVRTTRHRSAYRERGNPGDPLMIFVHGWPELGLAWRREMDHFAGLGWHCIAPDMRGYGDSSVPASPEAYALPEIVQDMVELHDALGDRPAVWVGHDWGAPVVWALAAHHAGRCRAVVNLCVPYLAQGFGLATLVPLVDRSLYPAETYPDGQWAYFRHYSEAFDQAVADFDADIPATLRVFFRRGRPSRGPSRSASVTSGRGWFGPAHRAPSVERDEEMMPDEDFAVFVEAFTRTGFRGACSWYVNDEANLAYAATAPESGKLRMPVLFVHAAWDPVCDTVHSRLAEPMRADCADLTEVVIESGHDVLLERPEQVNSAIEGWLAERSARM